MSRSRRTTTALIALAFVASACSGSSSDSGEVASTPSSSPPVTVGGSSPPPVTDATTTTTTTTTTTVAPTTSVDETASLIAEIEADLNEGERASTEAGRLPGSPESQEILTKYYAGPSLELLEDLFRQLVTDGLELRPNTLVPAVVEVFEILETTTDQATVRICIIDTALVVVPPTDSTPEVIVNDAITRYVTDSLVIRTDETWRLSGGTTVSESPGATSCV
jgi:hypothetical protein